MVPKDNILSEAGFPLLNEFVTYKKVAEAVYDPKYWNSEQIKIYTHTYDFKNLPFDRDFNGIFNIFNFEELSKNRILFLLEKSKGSNIDRPKFYISVGGIVFLSNDGQLHGLYLNEGNWLTWGYIEFTGDPDNISIEVHNSVSSNLKVKEYLSDYIDKLKLLK